MSRSGLTIRLAQMHELEQLKGVMHAAISELQQGFLDPSEIEASRHVMGLDTQLIKDRSYYLVEQGDEIVGCGGWSYRATLYGGDHTRETRDPDRLDPARDAARVRAMYTHPDHARKGIGKLVITTCENAAREAGFKRAELMATLSGEPLYRAVGYQPIEHVKHLVDGVEVPLIRMEKPL